MYKQFEIRITYNDEGKCYATAQKPGHSISGIRSFDTEREAREDMEEYIDSDPDCGEDT